MEEYKVTTPSDNFTTITIPTEPSGDFETRKVWKRDLFESAIKVLLENFWHKEKVVVDGFEYTIMITDCKRVH